MYDNKNIDSKRHGEFTGVLNNLIFDNLKKLVDSPPAKQVGCLGSPDMGNNLVVKVCYGHGSGNH